MRVVLPLRYKEITIERVAGIGDVGRARRSMLFLVLGDGYTLPSSVRSRRRGNDRLWRRR